VLVFIEDCRLSHLLVICFTPHASQHSLTHTAKMSLFMRVIHLGQAFLSGYAAYHSYNAITNLQTYEATSEKLAEWSNEAAKQLAQTRATQTTGALAVRANLTTTIYIHTRHKTNNQLLHQILLSSVTSLTLTFFPEALPPAALFAASPALVIVIMLARSHMKNYWAPSDGKTVGMRVPLPNMGQYNEAQRATEQLLEVLQWMEWSWVGASLGAGMVGY